MTLKKVFTNIVLSVFALTLVGANVSYAAAPTLSGVTMTPGVFDPEVQEMSISGTVDSLGYLTIQVFDINEMYLGNVVYYDYMSTPGTFEEKWDGTDRNHDLVPAGWYKLVVTFNNSNGRAQEEGWVEVEYGVDPDPAPQITNVNVTDDPFDPSNGADTTIQYTLSEQSDVTLQVFRGTSLVRNLLSTSSQSSGNHSKTWDGRDMNGQVVSEGSYKFYLVAEDQVTGEFDTENAYVQVLYVTPDPDPVPRVYNVSLSPASFDPVNNEITTVYYAIENCGDVDVKVYENGTNNLVKTLREDNYLCDVYYSDAWNGRDENGQYVSAGIYNIKVSVVNGQDTDEESRSVVVEDNTPSGTVPEISGEYASPTSFDPADSEITTLYYTLNTDANVSVNVYDNNDNLVASGATVSKSQGTHSATWDGRTNANVVVAEGLYYFLVSASNTSGSDDSERVYMTVDYDGGSTGTAPLITNEYVSPEDFNAKDGESTRVYYTLNTTADVTVEVLNDDNDIVRTLLNDVSQGSGSHSLDWNGEDTYGDNVREGEYTVKIEAQNSYGADVETVTVEVNEDGSGNNDIRIRNLELTPDPFNPDRQSLRIKFDLDSDKCADLDLVIEDDRGREVREIAKDKRICDGSHYYRWYGTDKDGDDVDEDDYTVVVKVSNSDGSDKEEEKVEVDYDYFDDYDYYVDPANRCAGYTDIAKDDPYCEAIEFAKDRDIFDGYPDGSFRPYNAINRAETVKVLLKGFNRGVSSANGTNLGFYDVSPGAWYMPYLRTAQQLGIIEGYPDGSFQPARTVNKVELLKMFLETANVPLVNCSYNAYADTPSNAWYSPYVCFAAQNSLLEADVYGNVSPAQLMTRGDVAVLFFEYYHPSSNYYGSQNYYDYNNGYDYDYYYDDERPRLSDVDVRDGKVEQGDNVYFEYELNTCADVTIKVYDDDHDLVKTLVRNVTRCKGNHTTVWDGEDDDNDEVREGYYTIEIEAKNSRGQDDDSVEVEVDNGNSSSNDEDPRLTNTELRDDDVARGTTVYVDYEINTCADITIKVYDDDNRLVKTLLNDSRKCEGEYTKSWNQKDSSNYTVTRGDYLVEVIAENDEGRDSEELDLEIK